MTKALRGTLVLISVAAATVALDSAELQSRTARSYDRYLQTARLEFLSRIQKTTTSAVKLGDNVTASPAKGDGIIEVPGGLVHHWAGATFVRARTLQQTLDVARSYTDYPRVYREVIDSKLLGHEGNIYRAEMRLKSSEGGISAVLQLRTTVEYFNLSADEVWSFSTADEIREVKNAGGRNERLLPPGNDSGYLWRANIFTHFKRVNDGVVVEMESLGLSRQFPPLLGWIIEPIARRLGRRSVESSLREFSDAVRRPN